MTSLLLLAWAIGCASSPSAMDPPPPAAAVRYLHLLKDGIGRTRVQMPTISQSAEQAAKRVISGGRIFVAGSQPEFASELLVHVGGLSFVRPTPPRADQINRDDVILYAARSLLTQNDHLKISRWRERGAYVVAFASARQSSQPWFRPDVLIDSGDAPGLQLDQGKLVPSDTAMNIINVWTWTGEFIAACTRQGKMPVVYGGMSSGQAAERTLRYAGLTFYPDGNLSPIRAGALGNMYLDCVGSCISDLNTDSIHLAAVWVQSASPPYASAQMIGPLFPDHFADPRAPQPFGAVVGADARHPPPQQVSLVLGYQDPPQLAIDMAHMHRSKLIYAACEHAHDDAARYILFIDPHYPREDACVAVNGYDVPILPAASVIQAAIYWSIVADVYPPKLTTSEMAD